MYCGNEKEITQKIKSIDSEGVLLASNILSYLAYIIKKENEPVTYKGTWKQILLKKFHINRSDDLVAYPILRQDIINKERRHYFFFTSCGRFKPIRPSKLEAGPGSPSWEEKESSKLFTRFTSTSTGVSSPSMSSEAFDVPWIIKSWQI